MVKNNYGLILKAFFWLIILTIAIVAIVITSGLLFSTPNAPVSTEPLSTEISSTTRLPNDTATQTSTTSNLVFSENFETGTASNFRPFPSSSFYVTKDETNNFVYEIANFSTSDHPAADFGSSSWKNYAVEYKVRFLEYKGSDAQTALYIRKAHRGGAGYHIELVPAISRIRLAYYNNSWGEITSEKYSFEKNTWYLIRAEVKGNEIRFFINNRQVIYAIDKRLQNGEAALMAGPGTNAQFDDIQVILFDE